MSLLIRLPEVLSLSVLSIWCEMKHIMSLDTSFLNKKVRKSFMTLLKEYPRYDLETTQLNVQTDSSLTWILARGIKLKHLTVTQQSLKFINLGNISKSKLGLQNLTSLSFEQGKDNKMEVSAMLFIINNCSNIKRVHIGNVCNLTDTNVSQISTRILQQLTLLSFHFCSDNLTSKAVNYLATYCHNLTDLKLFLNITKSTQNEWLKLIQANAKLTTLELMIQGITVTNNFFSTLLTSNTKISNIRLTGQFDINLNDLQNFLINAKHLQKLIINDNKTDLFINYNTTQNNTKFININATQSSSTDLVSFFENISRFETIVLNLMENVTSEVLQAVAKNHSTTLTRLILTHCQPSPLPTKQQLEGMFRDCLKLKGNDLVVLSKD